MNTFILIIILLFIFIIINNTKDNFDNYILNNNLINKTIYIKENYQTISSVINKIINNLIYILQISFELNLKKRIKIIKYFYNLQNKFNIILLFKYNNLIYVYEINLKNNNNYIKLKNIKFINKYTNINEYVKTLDKLEEYMCTNILNQNKFNCENNYNISQLYNNVINKECKTNSECPFYKKNLNYKNDRGGCINGLCEFPINIKRTGYKKYNSKYKPFCGNCKTNTYFCCEDQKNSKLYKNLKSPDYLFHPL